jgi:glycine/D-amino acid oxidase-like deaminating enzyme
VGWQGREGVYTAHEMLESYRLTRDNRIVGGAKRVRYGYGGRLLPDRDPGVAQLLEATFRRRFPELAGLEIDRHWGGPIAITLDFLPLVGRMREHENVLYAVSFAGHGLAVASYAGTMVADLIAGRSGPGEVLWSRRPFPLPPEPARWLVFRALTGYLGWQDARIDRAV